MSKVADPLREYVNEMCGMSIPLGKGSNLYRRLTTLADEIDQEHERRMEQCRYETKRAFAKYLRQITAEYEIGRKRKSWLRQMKMQLELELLRFKEAKHEDH